jgi:hypothetical protein
MKAVKSNTSGIVMVIVYVLLFLGIVLFFFIGSSCTHKYEKEEFLGTEYASAPEGFSVTDNNLLVNPSNINFVNDSCSFAAQFTHKVSWKITITGRTSRAIKYMEGLSDHLDPLSVVWDGSSSNMKFFKAGEDCDIVLSFLGTDYVVTTSIKIIQSKKYAGVLVSDFDGGGLLADPSWWYYYSDTLKPANIKEIYSDGIKTSPLVPVQGNSYLHQSGEDLDSDWYIGGLGYWYDNNLNIKLVELSENPEEIYLNAFVNANGNENTHVVFAIFEGGATRDIFSSPVQVKTNQWELVSLKLSTLTRNATSTGDGVMDVNKLKFMEIVPSPAALGAKCEMNVDYIIFTKGAPFRP